MTVSQSTRFYKKKLYKDLVIYNNKECIVKSRFLTPLGLVVKKYGHKRPTLARV